MKNSFFCLFAILMVVFASSVFTQSTKIYQITWDAPPVTDEVTGWSIYLEQKAVNASFIIQDGMDYSTTLDQFYKGDVLNTGQTGTIIYEVSLPLDGKWSVAGIISYTVEGTKSPVGASSAVKITKRPGKPTNVQLKPAP